MKLESIDSNYNVETSVDENAEYYTVTDKLPFKIYGASETDCDGYFNYRLPKEVAKQVSPKIEWLNRCGAGVRVTFSTNSKKLNFRVKVKGFGRVNTDSLLNTAGCTVYAAKPGREYSYSGRVVPSFEDLYTEMSGGPAEYSGIVEFKDNSYRDIMIYLPTVSQVLNLEVGLEPGSDLKSGREYKYKTPVVFYGSSITMGMGASRSSNSYSAMVSNLLNTDFINLGFSGCARGEPEIAEYISTLEMSAFVLDYDYNAPTPEHLEQTHEKFFKIIREKNPDLPIIMLTRPNRPDKLDAAKRINIVMNTFVNAKNSGDENVWFINGGNIFDFSLRESCTCDGTHPNDLGEYKIAEAVYGVLKPIILGQK